MIVDGTIATDRIRAIFGGSSGSGDADEEKNRQQGWSVAYTMSPLTG